MNTYVTWEQAKWLKEKEFDEPCDSIFKEDGEFQSYKNVGDIRTHFKNNEPINPKTWHRWDTSAPEQWQVIEWLRINHGIWVECNIINYGQFYCLIWKTPTKDGNKIKEVSYPNQGEFNSPQEAYSGAFDYILKELI